ncbi:MAG: isoprenoid biosynthesis glyoxalase ElbB [Elusimicrobia bacterium]|nr:isoprenoid biosynthesis glyoxalase ElbB [Elusimicrobiota bacterium]
MLKIGVILSGCGVFDGSEIHEAVLALLAIDRLGAKAACLAPDRDQLDVVDHSTGRAADERRRVLVESARLARGAVKVLGEARPEEFDAAILPGGYGAAKNLSTFARDGAGCRVDPDLARFLEGLHAAGKPIGAACIAPVILAKLFGKESPELTIGADADTAAALEAMGARHRRAGAAEVVVDERLRLATTPAYMLAGGIGEVAQGMERLVAAVRALGAAGAGS